MQRDVERVDAKANRAREIGMGDEKLRHLPRRDLADVKLAVGFECAARFEHRHPLNRVHVTADIFAARQKDVIFYIEDTRSAVAALEQPADTDEIPAFAVRHGRVGDALKTMRPCDDPLEKFVRTRLEQSRSLLALHEKIKSIDLLPHFARNLFAGGACVLACEGEAGMNRVRIFLL